MTYLYIFLFALAGGLIYRIRGGLIPAIPITVCRFVFSISFAVPAAIHAYNAESLREWGLFWAWEGATLLALILTDLAVTTGHGEWQGYKQPMTGTAEKEDFLIGWLAPNRFANPPTMSATAMYWYKFLGMLINGLIIGLAGALSVLSPAIAIGGAMKSVAYAIGWKIYPKGAAMDSSGKQKPDNGFNQATQIGELFTGFFMYAGIALNIAFHF
jgi:hypothetical protein